MRYRGLFPVLILTILVFLSFYFITSNITSTTITINPIANVCINNKRGYSGTGVLLAAWLPPPYDEMGISFIMFDLSDIPIDATIFFSELRLKVAFIEKTVNIKVHYCPDNTWSETDINWENKPEYEGKATDATIALMSQEWYTWDITKDMNKALSTRKISIVLRTETSRGVVSFYHRGEEYKPELIVSYT